MIKTKNDKNRNFLNRSPYVRNLNMFGLAKCYEEPRTTIYFNGMKALQTEETLRTTLTCYIFKCQFHRLSI